MERTHPDGRQPEHREEVACRSFPLWLRRQGSILICLLWVLLTVSGTLAKEGLWLELLETDTGQIAFSTPVREGENFTLWFLHSYDRAFFAEHYRVLGPGRILLTHMTFKSNLNGEGFEYHDFHLRKDGVGELLHINEPRKEVYFMMGSPDMANHTLILRDERIPLVKYVLPRTLVSLVVSGTSPSQKLMESYGKTRE